MSLNNLVNEISKYLEKNIAHDEFRLTKSENKSEAVFTFNQRRLEVMAGEARISQPTEIDVLLIDLYGSSYVIYILEINNEILHATLKDIAMLANDFFKGNYQVKERRRLFKKDRYIEFRSPIINNVAVETKNYRKVI